MSIIYWIFKTKYYDIGFEIEFLDSFDANVKDKPQIESLVKVAKAETGKNAFKGVLLAKKPGM